MPAGSDYLVGDGLCEFRPTGECSLVRAVEMVSAAIAFCRDHGIGRLLIDGRGLTGVPIPTLVDRFLMMEEWAQESKRRVAAVLVIEPEYIHPEKFGVYIGTAMGFVCNVFSSESDARAWLDGVASA